MAAHTFDYLSKISGSCKFCGEFKNAGSFALGGGGYFSRLFEKFEKFLVKIC